MKDLKGNVISIKFNKVPEKIKELKAELEPLKEKELDDLGAVVWFGKTEDGKCSNIMQLKFLSNKQFKIDEYWTFYENDLTFVLESRMAENMFDYGQRPTANLIQQYFKN